MLKKFELNATAFDYRNKDNLISRNVDSLNVGDWVLVEYGKCLYPGEVNALSCEIVTVNVMVSSRGGKYKWPYRNHINNYERTDIKKPSTTHSLRQSSQPFLFYKSVNIAMYNLSLYT